MRYSDLETSTKVILKVIFAFLIMAFLWETREIILILIMALILASAMDPLVDYLKEHKIPRSVSVLAVYLLVVAIIAAVFYLFIPLVVEQSKIFIANLPQYGQNLQNKFPSLLGNFDLSKFLGQQIAGLTDGGNVVSSTFGIFNGVIAFVSVLIISFYLVAEEKGMKAFIAALLPQQHHEFTITLVEKIQKKMGWWVLGQVIAIIVMFLTTWAGLAILHVPYALILGVIAGLFEVVPYIGPFLSAVPAIFIALTRGPVMVIGVIVLYILLHELEGYILVPKIMEKTVGTSSLAVLVALLVGFKLAGIIGLIISVPLIAAITVVIDELWPGRTV